MSTSCIRTVVVRAGLIGLGVCGLACGESRIIAVDDGGGSVRGAGGNSGVVGGWQILPNLGSRKVDLLFMVDNSASMAPLQAKLIAGFPSLLNALQTLPDGPPDLHIAVISSNTGPGKFDLTDRNCSYLGDAGRFQFQPRGACTTSPFLPGQTFIQIANGVPSYLGSLTDAFSCIAALGEQGCGFEGQLKSVRWALDPLNGPDENQGFLRTDATLAVVLVTNEDDCSLPDDSDLVDPTTSGSDLYGPLTSFRCNEFGHLCVINGRLAPPPRAAAQNLVSCMSNETPTGKLNKVADEVRFLKSLKSDPNQIFVAAITGPTTPYSIQTIQQGYPMMEHSCQLNAGEYADPAVRIQQWVNSFGANGLSASICADSMAPALQSIGQAIGSRVATTCVTGPFPYAYLSTQPDCRLADRLLGDNGFNGAQLVPNCLDSAGNGPCWTVSDDPHCPGGSKVLKVDRRGTAIPTAGSQFTCAPCPAGDTVVGCPLSPHRNPDAGPLP
jgi:hypothetical protein